MRTVIYTDEIDLDQWKGFLSENYPEITDEYEQYQIVADEVSYQYDDEYANLDRDLPGVIVAFADLGLWYGRRKGYRVLGSKLNSILHYCESHNEWYLEDGEVWSRNDHHDGTNYVNYRFLPVEQTDALDDDISLDELLAHTQPLGKFVAEVYGLEAISE